MTVKCPVCEKNHGELAPGDYRCVCTAEFRVESQANPRNPYDEYGRRIEKAKSKNPGMQYRPDEIAETMEGVSQELYGALWKIVVTLKPTQSAYYDGLTERQLVGRMKKNEESAETIANLKEVLKKEADEYKTWEASIRPEGGWYYEKEQNQNPHQAGRGRITPEGWREHPKHMPIPKGWQMPSPTGPVGMRVAKPRPGMVWIFQSSVAVTAPLTRAQRKGVPKKYSPFPVGRRASAPAAPVSFEQYTREEGLARLRAGRNPLDMQLTEREQRGIGSRLSLRMDRGVQKGSLHGIDMKPAPVVFSNDDVVVLKMGGHKYWVSHSLSGGSEYAYQGAEYQVYLRLPGEDSSMVRRIASFPVRG